MERLKVGEWYEYNNEVVLKFSHGYGPHNHLGERPIFVCSARNVMNRYEEGNFRYDMAPVLRRLDAQEARLKAAVKGTALHEKLEKELMKPKLHLALAIKFI